jgi:hypothetical protein
MTHAFIPRKRRVPMGHWNHGVAGASIFTVMPGHSHPKDGVASLAYGAGHPRLGVKAKYSGGPAPEIDDRGHAMPDDNLEKPQRPEDEARDRRTATIFLLTAGVVLVVIGVWLGNALVAARKADECISSGRRNCNPIEVPAR